MAPEPKTRTRTEGPSLAEFDRVAAAPVLKRELFPLPVVIDSVRLLKRDKNYLVHVRSKDGAEGVSLVNPPRGPGLAVLFKESVGRFFVGEEPRDLENTLWKLYRKDYKLYGLLFWSMQAWMEFALLDLLGRMAQKPIGATGRRHRAHRGSLLHRQREADLHPTRRNRVSQKVGRGLRAPRP